MLDFWTNIIYNFSVEKWRRGRRMVSAAFNPAVLSKVFLDVFNQQNQSLVEQLKTEADLGQYFDLWSYISKSSLYTIMSEYFRTY